MLSIYDPYSISQEVNSNDMWKWLIYMFCFSIFFQVVNWQKKWSRKFMLKQNLLDFSGLIDFSVKNVLVRKTPQILTIYVYQWQKRHQTRTCLAFNTKNCLSYRYGPHPKRCRRLDVRIGSEDLQTRSEHFPPMSS